MTERTADTRHNLYAAAQVMEKLAAEIRSCLSLSRGEDVSDEHYAASIEILTRVESLRSFIDAEGEFQQWARETKAARIFKGAASDGHG